MIYTSLTVIAHPASGSSGPDYNYDLPIVASDYLFSKRATPDPTLDDGILTTIKEGRTEGYPDITSLFMEVCDACGYNPFKVGPFQINTPGQETMIPDVIDAFMGEMVLNNANARLYYPTATGQPSANVVGYLFFGSGYSQAQAGYGNMPYGDTTFANNICYDWIRRATFFTTNDGVSCNFEIWPESAINTSSNTIDATGFPTVNDRIEGCSLNINIWKTSENKYNYNIKVRSFIYTSNKTDFFNNKFDGAQLNHIYNPANPYDNKQAAGDEGGDGGFDNTDDPVAVPALPTLDITSAGGISLFIIDSATFSSLMAYLESNSPVDVAVKWLSNPLQAMTACYVLPYPVARQTAREIQIMGTHTAITAPTAKPWTEHNMGSVYLAQGFGNCFLDYSPWTKVSIYLPFCGVKQLNADDTVGHNIGVVYQFDNFTGACVAYVTCDGKVRYTFTGSCAFGVPLSQQNWGQTYIAAAQAALSIAGGAVSGAMGAAAGSATEMGIGAVKGAVQAGGDINLLNAKPTISRSGTFTGAGAALGVAEPFLIIERPDKAKIEDPKNVIGITSGRTLSLGSISGFTMIEQVHLHGINATGPELDEIESLLHQGVIF